MAVLDLSPIEQDAVGELFNLGLGRAAAALSELVAEEVRVTAPSVLVLDRGEVVAQVDPELRRDAAAVVQRATGALDAHGLLVFHRARSLDLVRKLMPGDAEGASQPEAQREVLSEVGNLVLNGCFSSFANLLSVELNTGLPTYRIGELGSILREEGGADTQHVVFLKVEFGLTETRLDGFILVLLDLASLAAFRAALARLIG